MFYSQIFNLKLILRPKIGLTNDKRLQIYIFCVKRQAKKDFLKDVESTVKLSMLGKKKKKKKKKFFFLIFSRK